MAWLSRKLKLIGEYSSDLGLADLGLERHSVFYLIGIEGLIPTRPIDCSLSKPSNV